MLSGSISTAFGVATFTEALQRKINKQELAAKKREVAARTFGTRLATITKRVAAANVAAIPAKTVSFLGVGALVARPAHELYGACESMKGLDELYAGLGMAGEVPDDAMHTVCEPELPDTGDENISQCTDAEARLTDSATFIAELSGSGVSPGSAFGLKKAVTNLRRRIAPGGPIPIDK